MKNDRRHLLILLFNWLFFLLLTRVNELAARGSFSLHLPVLCLLFPALYFRLYPGFAVAGLTALLIASRQPGALFGFLPVLYCAIFLLLTLSRRRVRREKPRHTALLAFSGNGAILLAVTLFMARGAAGGALYWMRFIQDFVLSQTLVVFIAFPFLAFQRRILLSLGSDVLSEMPPP